jgi:hypothetical protein
MDLYDLHDLHGFSHAREKFDYILFDGGENHAGHAGHASLRVSL